MGARYLLLDEPTAGLDAAGRREVHAAIDAERQRAGVAVVTHDPEEFLGRADRMLVLSGGAPAYTGRPAGLLDDAGWYEATGLRLPDIVRAQVLARQRGAVIDVPAFEPAAAARLLRDAREVAR
jgi:energy-coupling factor transport system ATP-binding protein